MKKFLATLLTLALVVGASFVLTVVPTSAAVAESVVYTTADGQEVTLDNTVKSADDGKVTFSNGTLTLDNANGTAVRWMTGDLTIVVKGDVSLDTHEGKKEDSGSNNGAIRQGLEADYASEGNLTIRTEENSRLTVTAIQYPIVLYKGNMTFEGSGEAVLITTDNGQRAFGFKEGPNGYAPESRTVDNVLTLKDSVKVSMTGYSQNTLFVQAKSLLIDLQDESELYVQSVGNYWSLRLVNTVSTLKMSGSSVFTIEQGTGAFTDTQVAIQAGEHTKLTVLSGSDKSTAEDIGKLEVLDPVLNTGAYLQITASYTEEEEPTDNTDNTDTTDATDTSSATTDETDTSSTDSEKPTDTDTSSSSTKDTSSDKSSDTASSNTASSDAASESGSLTWLWIVIAAVVVVAIVVVAVVLAKKKKKD